jgi:hypothetical protein
MLVLRSSKAASQGNIALVAFSNKPLVVHSHRLCWSTPGKALLQRRGPRCYFSVQHDVPVTVAILRKLCAQHGVPETIFSLNGTQFTSHDYRNFCKVNAISHSCHNRTTPIKWTGRTLCRHVEPRHLKLSWEGDLGKILDNFLLACRKTPNSTLPQQRCPAEQFFGRKPRTTLDILLPI